MSDGPYRIEGPYKDVNQRDYFLIQHRDYDPSNFSACEPTRIDAERQCAELNAVARREAASEQMLEALKAVKYACVNHLPSYLHETTYKMVLDSITAAEGGEVGK